MHILLSITTVNSSDDNRLTCAVIRSGEKLLTVDHITDYMIFTVVISCYYGALMHTTVVVLMCINVSSCFSHAIAVACLLFTFCFIAFVKH